MILGKIFHGVRIIHLARGNHSKTVSGFNHQGVSGRGGQTGDAPKTYILIRGMPTRRGQSEATPPRASNPIKEMAIFREIADGFSQETRIAILLIHIFNRDRDRDENFQIKV